MTLFQGTQGYADIANSFITINDDIKFNELHQSILAFIPTEQSNVLDIGSGSGRDAHALSKLGHNVYAVDPTAEFIAHSKKKFSTIHWYQDGLPMLSSLPHNIKYEFILCHGVWQHIASDDRGKSFETISGLLSDFGIFALTLRQGAINKHAYYVENNTEQVLKQASINRFKLIKRYDNQPSIIAGKQNVTWTRLVFQKLPFML